jgi:hypothetical protein
MHSEMCSSIAEAKSRVIDRRTEGCIVGAISYGLRANVKESGSNVTTTSGHNKVFGESLMSAAAFLGMDSRIKAKIDQLARSQIDDYMASIYPRPDQNQK